MVEKDRKGLHVWGDAATLSCKHIHVTYHAHVGKVESMAYQNVR